MNLDNLLKEMKEKMQERDLSDKYLEENRHMTRTEMGIGEYGYGITTVPCEWVYDFLSDYKRILKENEELKNDYENLSNSVVVKNHCIKNSIPVQKVKDKIEELKKEGNYRAIDNPYGRVHFMAEGCDYKIQVLQELIEEREEK